MSLVPYLIEEASEVVDAIEVGSDADLCEELGDLLLQVYFHSEIARQQSRFDIEDVARGIADKLVRRHPHVFAGAEVPADKDASWEASKRAEKGRTSSLDGIAESLHTLARAQKVVMRSRAHAVEVGLPSQPITEQEAGQEILALVARAQASGIDADRAVRTTLRSLERRIRASETPGVSGWSGDSPTQEAER